MTINKAVFHDANILIYALDVESDPHDEVVETLHNLISSDTIMCTSHHVIEEVLHVILKLTKDHSVLKQAIKEIGDIPNLLLIEPPAHLEFIHRYGALAAEYNLGINDALILQLILDAEIDEVYSYDKHLTVHAHLLGIDLIET